MLLQMLPALLAYVGVRLHREERGADAIEYLLTIAVVMIAIVIAVAAGVPGTFVTAVLSAVNTAVVGCANGTTCT